MEEYGIPTYEVEEVNGHKSIKCLVCKMVSYNQNDIHQKYCANCNQFHDIMMDKTEM